MNKLIARAKDEPVLVVTFVTALLALLTAFNVPLNDAQTTAILGVLIAGGAFVARSKVKPKNKV